jgi:hypothetical protein
MIDDSALGCPLKHGIFKNENGIDIIKGPFVDWEKVRQMLKEKGII